MPVEATTGIVLQHIHPSSGISLHLGFMHYNQRSSLFCTIKAGKTAPNSCWSEDKLEYMGMKLIGLEICQERKESQEIFLHFPKQSAIQTLFGRERDGSDKQEMT